MTRIYLSGGMTGLPDNNFPAFHHEAARLRAMGFEVVNPAEIPQENPGDWAACMKTDIKQLMDCTGVALLPGWEKSKGARLEVEIARALGMRVTMAAYLGVEIIPEEALG